MCGDQLCPGVIKDHVDRRIKRRLEDDSCQIRTCRCNFKREVRAQSAADHQNGMRIDMAGARQVVERPRRILKPAGLVGALKVALAIATIVECENVHVGVM